MGIRAERKQKRKLLLEREKLEKFKLKKVTLTQHSLLPICKECNHHLINDNYSYCINKSRKPFFCSDCSLSFISTLEYKNIDIKCNCLRMTYIMLTKLNK